MKRAALRMRSTGEDAADRDCITATWTTSSKCRVLEKGCSAATLRLAVRRPAHVVLSLTDGSGRRWEATGTDAFNALMH